MPIICVLCEQFFNDMYDKTLLERLKALVDTPFARVTYHDAILLLQVLPSPLLRSVALGCLMLGSLCHAGCVVCDGWCMTGMATFNRRK